MTTTRFGFFILAAALLLCVPLIAMQFTDDVRWTAFDFLVAGVLLFGTAAALEAVLRLFKSTRTRLLLCGGVLLVLFLVWAELAVGIFGSPIAGS